MAFGDVKQGEIYWVDAADLDVQGHEQAWSRPYVIASRTLLNRGGTAIGVPLSRKLEKACRHRLLFSWPT